MQGFWSNMLRPQAKREHSIARKNLYPLPQPLIPGARGAGMALACHTPDGHTQSHAAGRNRDRQRYHSVTRTNALKSPGSHLGS